MNTAPKLLNPLSMLYVTAIIVSNVIAIKIWHWGVLEVPAAIIVYPLTFILDDIFTEVYGYQRIRPIIWMAFVCNIVAVCFFQISVWLPTFPNWHLASAYDAIFMQVPRIVLASFVATPTGQFVNAYVLAKLKLKMQGHKLSLRLVLSTFCGALVDSVLFICIGFIGLVSFKVIIIMILLQTGLKVIYEIILLPLSTRIIRCLKRHENSDVYDAHTDFNPFAIFKKREK